MMIEAYLSSSIAYNDLAKLRFNAVWVFLQAFMEQLKGAYWLFSWGYYSEKENVTFLGYSFCDIPSIISKNIFRSRLFSDNNTSTFEKKTKTLPSASMIKSKTQSLNESQLKENTSENLRLLLTVSNKSALDLQFSPGIEI
jgi:hypothetical protein